MNIQMDAAAYEARFAAVLIAHGGRPDACRAVAAQQFPSDNPEADAEDWMMRARQRRAFERQGGAR